MGTGRGQQLLVRGGEMGFGQSRGGEHETTDEGVNMLE